jgi:hypothetical protein
LFFSGRHRGCGRPRVSRLPSRHTPREPEKGIGRSVPTYCPGSSAGTRKQRAKLGAEKCDSLPRGSQSEVCPSIPELLRPLATQGSHSGFFLGDPCGGWLPSLPRHLAPVRMSREGSRAGR